MDAKSRAAEWMKSGNLDEQTKAGIKKMSEKELTDAFYKKLEFGTGGLRGIMGIGSNRINQYTVGAATQGFAGCLKKNSEAEVAVVVAYDSRNNSKELAGVAANVFSANNIRVHLFESLRPTPELSFAIRYLKCAGGVVVTASHNPKEYNGYKAYWRDGAQLVAPHDKNVMEEVNAITSLDEIKFVPNEQLIKTIGEEMDHAYLEMIKSLSLSPGTIDNQKDLKIVYSSLHGTGITLVPGALRALGFENVHIVDRQSNPDGDFPTVISPNPEEKEAMSQAVAKGKELGADLIMATDPDADRVGVAVMNTRGAFQLLDGNQTGALLIYYLLRKAKEKGLKGNEFIAKTIVTSELLKDIAEDVGVASYDTLTGFKFIAALIGKLEGKQQFIAGGEESYGYMIGDKVRDKDAVASCALIAEMTTWAIEQGKSLFELLVEINRTYGLYYESLTSVTKKGIKGAEEIAEMMRQYRSDPPLTLAGSSVKTIMDHEKQTSLDVGDNACKTPGLPRSNVLQFLTADGTKVSIRPSGTEPKIKFYTSVKTKLDAKKDYYSELENLKQKTSKLLIDLKLT